jgi:sterol desaturase/sphingolipid hydroxylase (fatty acid hydroxylase superfamily)
MNELIQFFTEITTEQRTIMIVCGLLFFLCLEPGLPLFKMKYKKFSHGLINLTFTIITLIINLLGAIGILAAVQFNQSNYFGVLHLIELPIWLYVIIGLTLMDLIGAWLIHWLEHSTGWMWRFHLIHHTDPNVDVTTGLRHHPGENILRLVFTILAILVTGASFGLVMMYQSISVFFAHLTHANIKVPANLDRILSYILVTPNFHKIHHHYMQPHTDSNYGNIFSIWDHVFGTVKKMACIDDLIYGVDTHMKSNEHSSVRNLLLIPFQPHRYPIRKK